MKFVFKTECRLQYNALHVEVILLKDRKINNKALFKKSKNPLELKHNQKHKELSELNVWHLNTYQNLILTIKLFF